MKLSAERIILKLNSTKVMRVCFYLSGLALLCVILAAGRIGNESVVYGLLMFLALIQIFFLYANDKFLRVDEVKQLFLIFLFFSVFMDAAFIRGCFLNAGNIGGRLFFLIFTFYVNVGMLFLFLTMRKARSIKINKEPCFRLFWKEWGMLIVIVCIFIIWGLVCYNGSLRVDSWLYYKGLVNASSWDFNPLTLSDLKVCGHYDYGFSLWMLIGVFLIPYNAVGVLFCEVLMGAISLFCVYRILQKLCRNRWLSVIGTAVFAFSPAFGGIIGELGTDFTLTCFFIWMFFCYLYDWPILQIAVSLFLCFSKETAVFPYVGFVVGLLLLELYKYVRNKDSSRYHPVSIMKRLLPAYLPGLVWLFHLVCDGFSIWEGGIASDSELTEHYMNTFQMDGVYIGYQSENLFIMHFTWVLLLIILIVIIVACIKKRAGLFNSSILLLVTSHAGFLFIELGFITHLHYRYIQLNIFFLICYLVFLVGRLEIKKISYVITTIVLLLFIVENYYIADPLTRLLYPEIDLGNVEAVSTWKLYADPNTNEVHYNPDGFEDSLMRNGMSNNRQYIYLGKILNIALNDIGYNRKTGLLMPFSFGGSSYGNVFGKQNNEEINWICYDSKTHILMMNNIYSNYLDRDYMVPFHLYWVKDLTALPDMGGVQYQDLYYIAFPFCEEDNQIFRDHHEILETKEYSLMGWKLQLYKVAQ